MPPKLGTIFAIGFLAGIVFNQSGLVSFSAGALSGYILACHRHQFESDWTLVENGDIWTSWQNWFNQLVRSKND